MLENVLFTLERGVPNVLLTLRVRLPPTQLPLAEREQYTETRTHTSSTPLDLRQPALPQSRRTNRAGRFAVRAAFLSAGGEDPRHHGGQFSRLGQADRDAVSRMGARTSRGRDLAAHRQDAGAFHQVGHAPAGHLGAGRRRRRRSSSRASIPAASPTCAACISCRSTSSIRSARSSRTASITTSTSSICEGFGLDREPRPC